MKNSVSIKKLLVAAVVCCILAGCGNTDKDDKSDLTDYTVQTMDIPPQLILNTDFRNMLWGMDEYEIAVQEGRYADHSYPDQLFYENIPFAGYNSRLVYRIDENGLCIGAEYIVTVDPENNKYIEVFESIDKFLSDMFGMPDEENSDDGRITRTTRTAVIGIYTDERNGTERIRIDFAPPEGYMNKQDESRVIYFKDNKPAGMSQ